MTSISSVSPSLASGLDQTKAQVQSQTDFSKVLASKLELGQQNSASLRKACQDMEAVFLNMMYTTMRSTVPKDSLLGNSNETDIMKSMLDTEMTKQMAAAGGIGLADLLYKQLNQTRS